MNNLAVTPNIANALQQYGVLAGNVVEAHPQSFYDFQTYATAGTKLSYSFFQNQIGSGGYTAGTTNMPSNGQFPNPQNFLWTGIEVIFISGQTVSSAAATEGLSIADDLYKIANAKAYVNFIINTKEYFRECPLGACPAQYGLGGGIGTGYPAVVASFAHTVGEMKRTSGQLIPSNTSFIGNIVFDATTATPSGIDGRIGMKIHGIWYQLAQ